MKNGNIEFNFTNYYSIKLESCENIIIVWYFPQYPLKLKQFTRTTNLLTYYQKLSPSTFKNKISKKGTIQSKNTFFKEIKDFSIN